MAGIISSIGSLVTGAISWVTAFVGALSAEGNELLLAFVLVAFVGLGVGLIKRLIRM